MGGGGGSGKVEYAAYVTTRHTWLLDTAKYYLDAIHAEGDGPYALAVCPSPDVFLASFATAMDEFETNTDGFNPILATSFWEQLFSKSVMAIDNFLDDSYIDNDMVDTYVDGTIADMDDSFYDGAMDDTYIEGSMGDMDDSFMDAVTDGTFIDASVVAHETILESTLDLTILPEYKGSMRTLGAIDTSAFVVGEAILRKGVVDEVAQYEGNLRNNIVQQQIETRKMMLDTRTKLRAELISKKAQLRSDLLNRRIQLRADMILLRNKLRGAFQEERVKTLTANMSALIQYTSQYLSTIAALLDSKFRYTQAGILAKKEEYELNVNYVVSDWLWHLDIMQHYANFLGAPGGSAMPVSAKKNETTSAIGNVASGAAVGAQVGGAKGAAVGAVLGGIYSMFD